jgi:hypothetical protein
MNFFEDEENQIVLVLDGTEYSLDSDYSALFSKYLEDKAKYKQELRNAVGEASELLQQHWNSFTDQVGAPKERYLKLIAKIITLESELY